MVRRLQDEILRRTVVRKDAAGGLVATPIKVKTARNILTTYFRSLIVEAMERHGVPANDPFPTKLRWPKPKGRALLSSDEPDPFEAAERDEILEWYRLHNRFWYPFVYFQFWVGTRPSEAIALRESDVDLERGSVRITKSRDEGEENEPKTKKSRRTIRLYPHVIGTLRAYRPERMHPKPEDYFFTGPNGGPVYARDWPTDYGFYDVLRRLTVRQRKLYCTRHTSISWQLTQGANPFGVAKYHGTSLHMIESNYGKFIPESGLDPALLRALSRSLDDEKAAANAEASGARNWTLNRTLEAETARTLTIPSGYVMRGGGLEPPRVLPH